jgi:hypothetical protein
MGTNVQPDLPGLESPEHLLDDDFDDLDVLEAEVTLHDETNSALEEPENPKYGETTAKDVALKEGDTHDTLKYQLLGPSLTKAGQDAVDQTKVDKKNSHLLFN